MKDSAGIEVVDVWEPLAAGDDGWRLTGEPLARIGAVAGQPEFQFSWIVGALRLAPDTIVVLDDESLELRFFDALGGHLVTVGGPGEGPGELTWAGHLSPFADGVQLKGGDKRIRFSASGDLIADERFDWTPLQQFLCPFTFFGDDVFLCEYVPGGVQAGDGMRAPRYRLFRTDWKGERRDTLGLFSGSSTASYRTSDGMFRTVEDPFARQDLIAVGGSPPIVAVLSRDRYELTLMTTSGEVLRVVRRHGAGQPGAEALEDIHARATALTPGLTPAELADLVPAPETLPAGNALLVDRIANSWVGRLSLAAAGAEHDTYEVFLADGRLQGEVTVPAGARLMDVGDDYVLLVRSDEFDVPFVELYGLIKD
ncbi:MAG: hypothetical protein F4X60_13890 [Gemmatimonadetes bacterium]|nr:hypothetical protein [Gemmatimonadota bacterium]MYB99628.1 hypothetical protein [Gemmatimonadota bacterium]